MLKLKTHSDFHDLFLKQPYLYVLGYIKYKYCVVGALVSINHCYMLYVSFYKFYANLYMAQVLFHLLSDLQLNPSKLMI
jgi:hypothetical protein